MPTAPASSPAVGTLLRRANRQPLRLLFVVTFLLCSVAGAAAQSGSASYEARLGVETRLRVVSDDGGTVYDATPADLSISGEVNDETGSGLLEGQYGPNRPEPLARSSSDGAATLYAMGQRYTEGEHPLDIGDGHILQAWVSGSLDQVAPQRLVSSDISQSGDITFVNHSPTATYFVQLEIVWQGDVTLANDSAPPLSFHVDAGFSLGAGRKLDDARIESLLARQGYSRASAGEGFASGTKDSWTTTIAIEPGQTYVFTVFPFVGGIGAAACFTDGCDEWVGHSSFTVTDAFTVEATLVWKPDPMTGPNAGLYRAEGVATVRWSGFERLGCRVTPSQFTIDPARTRLFVNFWLDPGAYTMEAIVEGEARVSCPDFGLEFTTPFSSYLSVGDGTVSADATTIAADVPDYQSYASQSYRFVHP